ncbi:MAG: RHS repeat-associated core domain-containing protein, partial [Candidatus Omnitrophota bacterium]
NMLTKGSTEYTCDCENRLTKVEKPLNANELTCTIQLKAGWNFVSLPVIPSEISLASNRTTMERSEYEVADVFSSLVFGVDYDQISRFNSEEGYFESFCNNPQWNQFENIEYLRGYQIYCLRDCEWVIKGVVPDNKEKIVLAPGINMVGADIINDQKTLAMVFGSIDYSNIKWYNPVNSQVESINGSHIVNAGDAYFIEINSSSEYAVEQGITITTLFSYDGDGGRCTKTVDGKTTTYIGSLFETTCGTDTIHIFLGDTRISSLRGAAGDEAISYYHTDHLGSTSDVTDNDGELLQHTEYTPYGEFSTSFIPEDAEIQPSWSNPNYAGTDVEGLTAYLFTGKIFDSSTGLYYYGARYYDPTLGCFITSDTIVPAPANPQTFNRYGYANNNPIRYTDPTGHGFWDKVKSFFRDVGDWFEDNWKYVASAVMIVTSIATFGWTSPITIGMFSGAVLGGATAYIAGGDVGNGLLFGTAIGGIAGAWGGGWLKGALAKGSFFAKGGFTLAEKAFITGMEFGISGAAAGAISSYAGGKGSAKDVLTGAGIGFGMGFLGGALVGGLGPGLGLENIIHGANFANPAQCNFWMPYAFAALQGAALITPVPFDDFAVAALAVTLGVYAGNQVYNAGKFGKPGSAENPLPLKNAPGPQNGYVNSADPSPSKPPNFRNGWDKIIYGLAKLAELFTQNSRG